MKLYLDVCCFNRPYDDQNQPKIELETIAKLNLIVFTPQLERISPNSVLIKLLL
ncbi:hypothetical protein [Methanobrevibacter curvatus]|uniref:PIN domain-containing protein n=1 Tax=Methanobrevibacter curvatus TaxID=49547 RepID=A0A166D7T0_9EURY|nr:hypothetical protein [Methanobrevibacter curvatus]KZX15294.1 hypothetical protein MBCUR_02910 [Methanobrevibacter curvatus]